MVVPVVVIPAQDNTELIRQAREIAARLGAPMAVRRRRGLNAIYREEQAEALMLVRETGLEFHRNGQVFQFHIGLAGLRILAIKRGQEDTMAAAMGLGVGDAVLDCTLGLASDAVVASFLVGEQGKVVGIESSTVTSVVVAHGLAHHSYPKDHDVESAMRRIVVHQGDHLELLTQIPNKSYDIVYFDPMFRRPISDSVGIGPLRGLANPEPLREQAIMEAIRVARRRVVIKERQGSAEFSRLGVTTTVGGRYRPLAYGVISCE